MEIGQQKTVERKDDDRYGTAVELGVSDRGNEKAHRDSEPGRVFDSWIKEKVLQSLEIGLFFCQIFLFII